MNLRLLPQILRLSPRLLHRRVKNFPHCRTSAGATEKCLSTRIHTRIKHHPLFYTIKVSQFPQRFIHDEFAFAEAPRKQSQLATHPRKLKLWSRKQRGRPRGRQVGLEENYIGVFATAHMDLLTHRTIHPERVDPRMISMNNFRPLETPILMRLELHHKPGFVGFEPWGFGRISGLSGYLGIA